MELDRIVCSAPIEPGTIYIRDLSQEGLTAAISRYAQKCHRGRAEVNYEAVVQLVLNWNSFKVGR